MGCLSLTVQGAVNDGLAIINQNGEAVTLFDKNAGEAGRFRLFDYNSSQSPLISFVAGGLGFFEATTVDFRDGSRNSMFKANPDRGYSFFGLSFVYVIFEDGTDMYWARSRVLEYLNFATKRLPTGVSPQLGPDATGVGWAFEYVVDSDQHDL